MKKQFVIYEIALKLKELGFEEYCLAYYDNNKELKIFNNCQEYYRSIKAPLWQQAIDFLIKKLTFYYPNIRIQIYSDNSGSWIADLDVWEGGTVLCEALEIDFDNKEEMIIKAIEQWKKEQ